MSEQTSYRCSSCGEALEDLGRAGALTQLRLDNARLRDELAETAAQLADVRGIVEHGPRQQLTDARKQHEADVLKVEEVEDELKWYGHCIAGGGPIAGYVKQAKEAERRWYGKTMPLLFRCERCEKDKRYCSCVKVAAEVAEQKPDEEAPAKPTLYAHSREMGERAIRENEELRKRVAELEAELAGYKTPLL